MFNPASLPESLSEAQPLDEMTTRSLSVSCQSLILFVVLTFCYRAEIYGQTGSVVPDSISFQGSLTDAGGAALDTMVNITTTLYEGGVAAYAQTHSKVIVSDGVFNVVIGPVDTVEFNRPLDIGITVGGNSEMTPRVPLQSVPYALDVRGFHAIEAGNGIGKAMNIIAGASNNKITSGFGGTIAGGGGIADDSGPFASPNEVTGDYGTIGGGNRNRASRYATVAGGERNDALGTNSAILGGLANVASAFGATVGGGVANFATGSSATIPGGSSNSASGDNSFAAGRMAAAQHNGAFVWNDVSAFDSLHSAANNTFSVRAAGGIMFYSNATKTTGVRLASNSGSWANLSDRNVKEDFATVDEVDILERLDKISVGTWRYIGQEASIRHMGPVAQDFRRAFGLGIDDRHITTIDGNGVALAAIKGLYTIVKEQQAEIEQMQTLIRELTQAPD
jgi:hypothetical protein